MSYFYDEELPAGFQDADIEQRQFEEEGNRYAAMQRKANALREAGNLLEAAKMCPHGLGYPLSSPAATNAGDQYAGELGWRCVDCGSRLTNDPFGRDYNIMVPCEIQVR